jgi:hypothetical protein
MLTIDDKTIAEWCEEWKGRGTVESCRAEYAPLKTSMTPNEKSQLEQMIAEDQMEIDPQAEKTSARMVGKSLIKKGFHPAFQQNGLVNGQDAFEQLKATTDVTPPGL